MGPFAGHCVSLLTPSSCRVKILNSLFKFICRVAIKMVAQLCAVKQSPDRLILESPFNNIRDVFRNHPLTQV